MIEKIVKVTVDRPMGSYHPEHKDLYYPITCGVTFASAGGN